MPSSPAYTPPPKEKEKDLPSDSGWDTAETVTSMPDAPENPLANVPPAAPTPKGGIVAPVSSAPVPPAPQTPNPVTPRSVPPPAVSTSPGPSLQGLSAPMREEVWAIVRAAVTEATTPMISKQRELEERVVRAEQAAANANAAAASAAAVRPQQGSIPIIVGGASVTPTATKPRLSVPPGVYGVAVIDPGPVKPAIDLENVGPIHDMPDFGNRGKTIGRVIAVIMILAVVGAFAAMIASRS